MYLVCVTAVTISGEDYGDPTECLNLSTTSVPPEAEIDVIIMIVAIASAIGALLLIQVKIY